MPKGQTLKMKTARGQPCTRRAFLKAGLALAGGGTLETFAIRLQGATSDKPIRPTGEVIPLFNGTDLSGLYPWLRDSHDSDPRGVFSVADGLLRISGEVEGYIATRQSYQDYRLLVEYKW